MRLVMSFSYDLFSYIFIIVKKTELLCNESVCVDDLCGFLVDVVVVEAMQHN